MRKLFDERARIARMLEVEAALARAQAKVGVIPVAAAASIAAACRADSFDLQALARGAREAGNLAIPLVAALTCKLAENGAGSDDQTGAQGYVHWGATSQDLIDTGMVLQMRAALELIDIDVARLDDALTSQIERHRNTVLAGRTWLQQALPTTLGFKLAAVLAALRRDRARLTALRPRLLVLQFGGAVGTLAALGERGLAVEAALAAELRLAVAPTPWHTQRDNFGEAAATLALLTATLGKLARDLALLAQSEVGEAFEAAAPGRGGSSTLPQKRNPVGAAIAIAAALRIPALVSTVLTASLQEHERGLGNWPAEWETLPEIFLLAAGALDAMIGVVAGLEVDAVRMRANIDAAQGQILAEAVQMALAPSLGRDVAHRLVGELARRAAAGGRHLRGLLAADPTVVAVLDAAALDRLFDPRNYLGSSEAFIDRALATS